MNTTYPDPATVDVFDQISMARHALKISQAGDPAGLEAFLSACFRRSFRDGYTAGRNDSLAALPVIESQTTITLVEEDGGLCLQNADLCPHLRAGDYGRGENRTLVLQEGDNVLHYCSWPEFNRALVEAALRQERDCGFIAVTVTTALLPNGDEVHF